VSQESGQDLSISAKETAVIRHQTPATRADTSKSELTEQELDKVCGGIISPRDAASGLPTGKRMHKPL
jgi:hypothetical protein